MDLALVNVATSILMTLGTYTYFYLVVVFQMRALLGSFVKRTLDLMFWSENQVDLTEGRYLLSGASDASAAVFDVQRASEFEGGGLIARHKSLFVIDKQHEQGHKYAVSSATWYPFDTGLFVTGSFDHHINVWDTNTAQVDICASFASCVRYTL